MGTVLCPLDLSPDSTHFADYAAAFSVFRHTDLLLIHVIEIPTMYADVPMTALQESLHQLEASALEKLDKIRKILLKKHPGLVVNIKVCSGDVIRKIDEAGQEFNIELMIIGATGKGRIERLFIGSTTTRVLRHTNVPVLVVPIGSKFKKIRRMIFATDLKEDNLRAADAIVPLADAIGAELVFVFVDDKHIAHSKESVNAMTRKIKSKVNYEKISGYIVLNNSVKEGLEYFLKKVSGELLVMFTHRRSNFTAMVDRSNTQQVAHRCRIPLLVFKEQIS